MLRIDARFVETVSAATGAVDLYEPLQKAIELEHSTIPPYLLAAYSLVDGRNTVIRRTLIDIAKEEMLHMAILCNILNAIGGRPRIGDEDFIPRYPDHLPMGVAGSTLVGLRPFSADLVENVFMEIEKPEQPIPFARVMNFVATLLGLPRHSTIGAFYGSIVDKIEALGDSIFTGDPSRQVTGADGAGFPPTLLYRITDSASAARALRWVVQDGEGTASSPLDQSGHLAHYYRFAEIRRGKGLVPDSAAEHGYSYSGGDIPFDPEGVYAFPDNPKAADLPPGSFERALVDQFNQEYFDMLRNLDRAFDGQPAHIRQTKTQMIQLRGDAVAAMQMTAPSGAAVAVTFEYMPPA